MTIEDLQENNLVLLECISGSRAYGLQLPTSDTDIRGVFYQPKGHFYGFESTQQVSNSTNDIVYSELGRCADLLAKNNPTMIELLNSPADTLRIQHQYWNLLKPEDYLSKKCKNTFAGYAIQQIRKARGLNKKIVNPVEKERKGVLDFCYVVDKQGAISVSQFLKRENLNQEDIGLAKIPHMHELYGMYYEKGVGFKGIIQSEKANDISLSSVPKGLHPITYMAFNKSGYSKYCKSYKEYWDWVERRNEDRYSSTVSHGKNYDAKNMMHTFRLLRMAKEIATEGKVHVKRIDRDFLLSIRQGVFEYDELMAMANDTMAEMERAYQKSALRESPDITKIEKWLINFRRELY